jgi:hypothetical protein
MFEAVFITIATAATPLLIAAMGELVVERSGVLNLGVEGMMIMGAVTGFGVTIMTGSPWIGVFAAIIVGALFSLLFAFLTLTLVTNQVATGLALTLLGLGLSGMIGEAFIGMPGIKMGTVDIPFLSDLPYIGRLVFGQDPLFYVSIILTAGVAYFLFRTKAGLTLRSVGDNHTSAHALGINVIAIRYLAVLRRPCRSVPCTCLRAAVGRGHECWTRLDRTGSGGVRVLASVARAGGGIPLRRRVYRAIARAGIGLAHTFSTAFRTALSGNHRGSCSNLTQQASDDGQHPGLAGTIVRTGSLIRTTGYPSQSAT